MKKQLYPPTGVARIVLILLSLHWRAIHSARGSNNGFAFAPSGQNGFDTRGFEIPATPPISIVSFGAKVNTDGSYNYEYETENGIQLGESGYSKPVGVKVAQVAEGSFSYISPEGQTIQLSYTADENGFHPQGEHLPTSPPIPPEILKTLQKHSHQSQSFGNGESHSSFF